MKPHEYSQMIKHMTRNDNTPEENRIADLKINLPNQKRMLKKRNEVGIDTTSLQESIIKAEQEIEDFKAPIKQDDPMTTWVKNNNANNKNPGTFKRLVEEDEKAYKKSGLDKVGENIIDAMVVGGDLDPKEQLVTYDSATGLFSNKKKDVAFKDVDAARKHNQTYEKYVPEIQKLKKAVEVKSKNKPFINKPKQVGKPLNIQKIDPIISDPYSAIEPKPVASIDPELKYLEEKYKAAQEQSYQEKVKNNSMGLRYFDPIKVNRDD